MPINKLNIGQKENLPPGTPKELAEPHQMIAAEEIMQIVNRLNDSIDAYNLMETDLDDLGQAKEAKGVAASLIDALEVTEGMLTAELQNKVNGIGGETGEVTLPDGSVTEAKLHPDVVAKVNLTYDLTPYATNTALSTEVSNLKGGVVVAGDTLNKLYNLFQTLNSLVTGTTPDGDSVVDTVQEILAIFATYPEGADMVQALAAKVNTSAIINTLAHTTEGGVLDARQGKALKDLVDGLTSALSGKQDAATLADSLPPVDFPQFGEPTLVNGVKTYVSQDIIDAQTRADQAYDLAASAPTGTGPTPNPKEFYFRWSGATNEAGITMLSGAATANNPMENNNLGVPFVMEMNTGTTATGAVATMQKSTNGSITSSRGGIQSALLHTMEMEMYVRFNQFTSAADATDTVVCDFGFQTQSGLAHETALTGVWAKLTHNGLQLTSRAGSTSYTNAPEITTLAVETWYKLKIVYVLGLSVKLYINDVLISTLTAGLPSVVPATASSYFYFPALHYFKTAGVAPKIMRWGMGYYKFTLV